MDQSIYRSIISNDGNLYIRLFILSPGPPTDQLSGTLVHARGDDYWKTNSVESFEALSYTWGSSAQTGPVTINGRPCLVGSNLYAALLALRYEDKPRALWIDAICINQDDIQEKNMHVPLMHLVYQQASRVVIWLGRPFEESDLAFAHLDLLWETEDVDGFVAKLVSAGATPSNVENGIIWRPLARLFSLPWWSRMWVLQEAYFANQAESIIMCGNETRPWAHVIIASGVIQTGERLRKMSPLLPATLFSNLFRSAAVTLLAMRASETSRSLLDALRNISRLRQATDPRDKIFALLNLLDKDEWPCEPDYSVDAVELYTRVAIHFMRKSKTLEILSECAVFEMGEEEKKLRKEFRRQYLPGLPSWAPDWTLVKTTPPFSYAEKKVALANSDSTPVQQTTEAEEADFKFRIEDGRILVVQGIVTETIVTIHGTQFRQVSYGLPSIGARSGMPGFFEAVQSLRADIRQAADSFDVEWALLIGEVDRLGEFSKNDYVSWRQIGSPEPNQQFYSVGFMRTMNRRIAATSLGRLALVPEAAEEGDAIAFLVGAPSAMLLRPVLDKELKEDGDPGDSIQYRAIEESYVEGCSVKSTLRQVPENIQEIKLR
ncbi:hypothetical protein OQA88_3046 [Cercophora sp. LCS_1]